MSDRKLEDYLFKIVKRTLDWAEVEYEKYEVADLVMLDLINEPIDEVVKEQVRENSEQSA